jgi:hypothetical protein
LKSFYSYPVVSTTGAVSTGFGSKSYYTFGFGLGYAISAYAAGGPEYEYTGFDEFSGSKSYYYAFSSSIRFYSSI